MEGLKKLFSIVLASACVTPVQLNNNGEPLISDPVYRLPETLLPTYYDLAYTLDPNQAEFGGYVFIHFDVAETVDTVHEIYLHADLDFLTLTQIVLNNQRLCSVGKRYEEDILLIDCYSFDITGKDNQLFIEFNGKFSTEDGFGLVKTSYRDEGSEKIIIESNFRPTYARRAFPCFDEPKFRASFSLRLSYPVPYKPITNTPVSSEYEGGSGGITEFQRTPNISPHLLSIFFSTLEPISSSEDEYGVKVYGRPEVINRNMTGIASAYTGKVIEQIINYTGVEYNNLNATESYQVALPNYYSDVMGNFGLFTYSESELLDEGDKTAARVRQDIITNIAYKLSHQWFGGDISTKWWSDVWANEAVATYFKYIISDKVDEELELKNQFMVEVVAKALQYDALPSAQPLSSKELDVNLSRDIENKLDLASYLKGACLIHMMTYVLRGAEYLQSGLQYHLEQRQDSTTDGQDILLNVLKSSYSEFFYPFLETWAFSPGFPLVSSKIELENNIEITVLSQKRFVYPIEDSPVYDNDKWDIPITSLHQYSKNFSGVMDLFLRIDEELTYVEMDRSWHLFNGLGGSLYRVNYEDKLWRRIIRYLKSEERTGMEILNRAKLVDDIFNVARIGDVSYSMAFDLANYLVNETGYYPWYSALNAFSYLLGKLEDDEVEENLKKYILDLMDSKVYIPSGISEYYDFAHIDLLKTIMILKWACDLGHQECIAYATNRFKTFKEDQTSLKDYNFRGLIFCNGIRHSQDVTEDWAFLWSRYASSPSVHERVDILNALGCAQDKTLLRLFLQRTISMNKEINKLDSLVVFKSVLSNSFGLDVAMEFLQDNLAVILSFYKGVDIFSEMLYGVAEKLVTDEDVEWLKNLVDNRLLNHYEDVKSKAIVLASVNNYWKHHYQSEVKKIFPATSSTTPTMTTTTTVTTTTTGSTSTTEPSTTTESSSEKLFTLIYISAFGLLFLIFF